MKIAPRLSAEYPLLASMAALFVAVTAVHAAESALGPDQASLQTNAFREFSVEQQYLNIPIKNGAVKRKVTTFVDGRLAVTNDIELADAQPDWWAAMDVSAWRGKTVRLQVDQLPGDSMALNLVQPSDSIQGAENLYHESLRPQLHFSPRRGWTNDPNGLSFYRGEYHLFFQHNPYGWAWGNMHWGHATSRDLVHWREHGDVLAPDGLGPMYSGSAVVDWKNTSGFGRDGRSPLVLIYTAAGNPFTQCLAFSNDGRTFTKFSGNPVLGNLTSGNRDPKVAWYEPTQRWVMVLYVGLPIGGAGLDAKGKPIAKHTIHFFTSPNLRDWTLASVTDGGIGDDHFLYECPDFFELPVDGAASEAKWVLSAASGEYAVGSFDGTKFTPETARLPGPYGHAFYAAQTYSDMPDGRRIQIGWGRVPSPGMPFNQLQLLPCELRLRRIPEGPRLTRAPIPELAALRDGPNQSAALTSFRAELIELQAEFEPGSSGVCEFRIRGAKILYDGATQEVLVNGLRAPAPLIGGKQRLTVYIDRTVMEVYASAGLTYVPMPFIPKPEDKSVTVDVRGANAKMTSLQVYKLKSIWEPSSWK